MALQIKKVGVIGAGTMGAGIAAQVANAGYPVVLLDIVPQGAANRNAIAEGAVAKLLKTEPAAFMTKQAAKLVTTGNVEDDLAKLADCDWIIEAVLEKIEIKHDLYRKLIAVRRPGTAISSNTSTIPLAALTDGLGEAFRKDFLVTHFFNPPRYMRLLEIVAGPDTDKALVESVVDFGDRVLGKSIVRCEDSPGFIANRLGIYWMQVAMCETLDAGITVEEADAIFGRPMGVPKTGVFGLMDLVGIDLGPYLNASMSKALPPGDAFHAVNRDIPLIGKMIAGGYTGRKGKGGFYRLTKTAAGRVKETLDLATGEYRAEQPAKVAEAKDLATLLAADTKLGHVAFRVLGQVISYAATLVPTAAADIAAIDEAMRLGYNWKWGPFELADKIGADKLIARLDQEGIAVPALLRDASGKSFYRLEGGKRQLLGTDGAYHTLTRAPGVLLLEDIKLTAKPVVKNGSASVWDIGDGVLCFEFTSKSNSLDEKIIDLLGKTVALVQEKYKALVIYNEGGNFSLGANLGTALFAANIAAWGEIEKSVAAGQQAYKALKYAPFPVVVAPAGMALGGGCEIALHADAIQAHAETYIGLVETGVGLLPGWGGCGEMIARFRAMQAAKQLPRGPMPAVAKAFELISTAQVAKSAHNAKELGFLRESDGITMNRYRLLADAKAKALSLVEGYAPPEKPEFARMPGAGGKAALQLAVEGFAARGIATPHDVTVADRLADALTGGDCDPVDVLTEQQMLDIERAAFMALIRTPQTLARIEHTLTTGKPLRN
jgi:3-hydroxyacyl-CoA dehydrogenase